MIEHYIYHDCHIDGLENIESYCPGGYHPVSIGDTLNNRRYRVVHKLGTGASATAWLARDTLANESFSRVGALVCLKVMTADASPLSTSDSSEVRTSHALQEFLRNSLDSVALQPHLLAVDRSFIEEGPNGIDLCLVSKLAGPSISSMAWSLELGSHRLRNNLTRKTAREIALAIQVMHSAGYAWR
jgi:serine/threonine-protein kinase SRPK3